MTSYQGASADAIQRHYDLSNDFFALWLDAERVYSCALFDDPDLTLEQAQNAKFDYLAGGAKVRGATRVLDVGCGWGALLRRLAEEYQVPEVVGLTLSNEQAEYVTSRSGGQFDVRVQNWADHEPERPYDAIISIGAFEHFADYGMSRQARIAAYRDFFTKCRGWLPPGGRLALQTVVKGNNNRMSRQAVRDLLFIIDHIFTESELPWPSEILEASERLFDVVSVRNDPDHYARTCRLWHQQLVAHRDEAEAIVGAAVVADYERYLTASSDAFGNRHIGLMRLVLERV
jgi:cyclopropane-fatty-acyl-phospholipid synthase